MAQSALIQRGDSWPPLPRVKLIQKVSTKGAWWVGTPLLEPTHDRTVGRPIVPRGWFSRHAVVGSLPAPRLALGDKMVARPAPCGRG